MRAFISIGFYSVLEQELFSSPAIGSRLVGLTRHALEACGITVQGLLSPSALINSPLRKLGLPVYAVNNGERYSSEKDTLVRYQQDTPVKDDEWMLIVRPGLGWITENRTRHFTDSLNGVEENEALSVLPVGIAGHPLWNTFEVDSPSFSDQRTLRVPKFHFNEAQDTALVSPPLIERVSTRHPGLQDALQISAPPKGSQHLPELYKSDDAIQAFRVPFMTGEAAPKAVIPAPNPPGNRPMHERIPLFETNRNTPFDLSSLEKMLEIHCKDAASSKDDESFHDTNPLCCNE